MKSSTVINYIDLIPGSEYIYREPRQPKSASKRVKYIGTISNHPEIKTHSKQDLFGFDWRHYFIFQWLEGDAGIASFGVKGFYFEMGKYSIKKCIHKI